MVNLIKCHCDDGTCEAHTMTISNTLEETFDSYLKLQPNSKLDVSFDEEMYIVPAKAVKRHNLRVLEAVDDMYGWKGAESAPKTGEHILVTVLGNNGFGYCGGKYQDFCAVVHYWDNPGEEGFYLSSGNDDENTIHFTHWISLSAPSAIQEELRKFTK